MIERRYLPLFSRSVHLKPGLFQKNDGTVWYRKPNGDENEIGTGGGRGGAAAGAARVLGPFPFAFDDAGLEDGIAFYTPTVGDILLDAWIEVTEAWDGTTPLGDIGYFADGGEGGLFGYDAAAIDVSQADEPELGTPGLLQQVNAAVVSSLSGISIKGTDAANVRVVPGKFVTADPLLVVVSQDGEAGGADPGATQGSGAVYLVVATPSLT